MRYLHIGHYWLSSGYSFSEGLSQYKQGSEGAPAFLIWTRSGHMKHTSWPAPQYNPVSGSTRVFTHPTVFNLKEDQTLFCDWGFWLPQELLSCSQVNRLSLQQIPNRHGHRQTVPCFSNKEDPWRSEQEPWAKQHGKGHHTAACAMVTPVLAWQTPLEPKSDDFIYLSISTAQSKLTGLQNWNIFSLDSSNVFLCTASD